MQVKANAEGIVENAGVASCLWSSHKPSSLPVQAMWIQTTPLPSASRRQGWGEGQLQVQENQVIKKIGKCASVTSQVYYP